jgi:hypothetical protein
MWRVAVILAVAAIAIVLGPFNLGLITVAGAGRAMVRYQGRTSLHHRSRSCGA